MKYLKRTKLPRTSYINCCNCGIKMKCIEEHINDSQRLFFGREAFAHGTETWQCSNCKQKTILFYHLSTAQEDV